MALTSPYNFVPLNSKVYIPDWYGLVSQDIPFEDGEDGYIELTWHNDSPLFIRDKDKDDPKHAPMNINGRYFIPGSSIKGMLRNVLSILSFGKMQEGEQYQNQKFQRTVIINNKTVVKDRKFSIEDLVNKRQPQTEENSGKQDLCELIFGWVIADGQNMKGRVQVGNAFASKNEEISLITDKTIVLGQPQASYFPLYIDQDQSTDKPKTYDNGECISGRKRYRIHKGFTEPKNVEPGDTTSTFKAIPAGCNFVTRINLHNMRPAEIGALLSAITIHNTKGIYHNIGAAKAFGYGKIRIEGEVKLFGLNYTLSYYLKAFEDIMEGFYKEHYKNSCNWKTSDEIKTLLGTMTEHKSDDVRFMNPNEYKDAKKSNKGKLEDTSDGLQSISVQEYEKTKKSNVTTCKLKVSEDIITKRDANNPHLQLEGLTKLNHYVSEIIDYREYVQEDATAFVDLHRQIQVKIDAIRLQIKKTEWEKDIDMVTSMLDCIGHSSTELTAFESYIADWDSSIQSVNRIISEMQDLSQETSSINNLLSRLESTKYEVRLNQFKHVHSKEYCTIEENTIGIDKIIESGKLDEAKSKLDIAKRTCDSLLEELDKQRLKDQSIIDATVQINNYLQLVENKKKDLGLRGKLDKQGVNGEYLVKDWKLCNKKINQYKNRKPDGLSEQDVNDIINTVKQRLYNSQDSNWREGGQYRNELANHIGKERADELFTELNSGKQS